MEKERLVVILLGGNVGDTIVYFKKAEKHLVRHLGKVYKKSHLYSSKAWGKTDQNDFLNQILVFKTGIEPIVLLDICQQAENENGRKRTVVWGERTIDIDILYVGNEIITESRLVVPHPYIAQRRFTLLPLAEILPDFIHPIYHKSQSTLLDECEDSGEVTKLSTT
jgi:2-amino-4-hydroxy-6-hydroxymethyldihydropteridine diphosphokinase